MGIYCRDTDPETPNYCCAKSPKYSLTSQVSSYKLIDQFRTHTHTHTHTKPLSLSLPSPSLSLSLKFNFKPSQNNLISKNIGLFLQQRTSKLFYNGTYYKESMKCRKEKDHLLDLQIDGTITIKDTLQKRRYENVDCIYEAIIQCHGCYFINNRGPRNFT